MNIIDSLFGHPYQVQPAHIVVTSPYFDNREVEGVAQSREHRNSRATAPIERIVKLRKEGHSFRAIGERLQIHENSVRKWYYEVTG